MTDLLSKTKAVALFAWDFFVPRFVSEDVALTHIGGPIGDWGSYDIVCSIADIEPKERYDGIASVDAFQFLGFGITYRAGNFRPFKNPHDAIRDVINRGWDEANG